MYIYFISSEAFGENIHKLIHSKDKREVIDMIKSHQLLYRKQFDIKELYVDINEQGYNEFLKNIDCYKDLDRFYKFEANLEEFKNLIEAYCTFNKKLSKFSIDENKYKNDEDNDDEDDEDDDKDDEDDDGDDHEDDDEDDKTIFSHIKEIKPKIKLLYLENYQNKFADNDFKNSRVSYIYDDKADTLLYKQLFGDEYIYKDSVLDDAKLLRDNDNINVLKDVKKMTDEEWKIKSNEMNSKINDEGSIANLLSKYYDNNLMNFPYDDDDDDDNKEEDPKRVIIFVNNVFLEKKIIYFEEDEIKTIENRDFNEFEIIEKFIIPDNDMIISIIMYKLQKYLNMKKELTISRVYNLIKKAEIIIDNSSDDEEDKLKKNKSCNNTHIFKIIQTFMNKHCIRCSGNKEQAKLVFNKFSDYIYNNNLNMMHYINKSTFTKIFKNHFPYKRFSNGMYWFDMKLIN